MLPGLRCGLIAPSSPTLNGSFNPADKGSGVTLSNANLTMSTASGTWGVRSTNSFATGKYYYEATVTNSGGIMIGVGLATASLTTNPGGANSGAVSVTGAVLINGSTVATGVFSTLTNGDVVGVQLDAVADTIAFRKNGGSFTTAYSLPSTASAWFIHCGGNTNPSGATLNLAPVYSIPSGYSYWGN